ncbi:hydrogenase maturation protease [Pseudonocardia hispaniensis]|uniref:Hydrogenase maturation protease n=1 Tax=Pseudonocardia hispaniensis TaxID=904933 RepID=A0ABW1J2L7_9PSEU
MNVLVAGVGNLFLSDDGFGVEVARRLRVRGGFPAGVEVVDVGIRGVHLAYQLLEGYQGLILIDAVHRDGPPGTVYRLEHTFDASPETAGPALDGHAMSPDVVLGLLHDLAAANEIDPPLRRVLVVGCEPAVLHEGMGLSAPVAAAVEPAMRAVDELINLLLDVPEGARS